MKPIVFSVASKSFYWQVVPFCLSLSFELRLKNVSHFHTIIVYQFCMLFTHCHVFSNITKIDILSTRYKRNIQFQLNTFSSHFKSCLIFITCLYNYRRLIEKYCIYIKLCNENMHQYCTLQFYISSCLKKEKLKLLDKLKFFISDSNQKDYW